MDNGFPYRTLSLENLRWRVSHADKPPPLLLFWLQHYPGHSGELCWVDCPRADWLGFIAAACGYPAAVLRAVELAVEQALDARREVLGARKSDSGGWYTPTLDAATEFRRRVTWKKLMEYPGARGAERVEPIEHAP